MSNTSADVGPLVFLCASTNDIDQRLLDKLRVHLKPFQINNLVRIWSIRDVPAGARTQESTAVALAQAQRAVLWLSPEFFADPSILSLELPALLARWAAGLPIIPVLARPCHHEHPPELADMQLMPADRRALSSMDPAQRDEALLLIVRAILDPAQVRVSRPLCASTPAHPQIAAPSTAGPTQLPVAVPLRSVALDRSRGAPATKPALTRLVPATEIEILLFNNATEKEWYLKSSSEETLRKLNGLFRTLLEREDWSSPVPKPGLGWQLRYYRTGTSARSLDLSEKIGRLYEMYGKNGILSLNVAWEQKFRGNNN